MLRRIAILAFMLLVAVIQSSLLPAASGFRPVPDLMLVLAVLWAISKGFEKALPSLLAFSVIMDVFRSQPIGIEAVSLTLIAFGTSSFSKRFAFSQNVLKPMVIALIVFGSTLIDRSIASGILWMACRFDAGQCHAFAGWDFWRTGALSGMSNVVLAAVVYLPFRKMERLIDMYEYKRVVPK